MSDILYEKINYGSYILDYEDNYALSENVKYAGAEFNKLHVRRVRLPDGKNNVVYLLSNTFTGTLGMLKNFIIPPSYRRMYYPQISFGTFMKRRYKLRITDKKERDELIHKQTKLTTYPNRVLPKTQENVFFATDQLFSCVLPLMERMTIKRCYEEFYPEFISILNNLTPPKIDTNKGVDWDNRIIIIDAESFAFKSGASLEENKTNPLYLLYLAYLRNKDLSKLNIDIDMMICSKNMFMKFNPSKLNSEKWMMFRRALFRIMNANLDDYTERLSKEEKSQLEETSKDRVLSSVVSNTIEPYTKFVSGSTKSVLQHAVETKVRKEVAKKLELDNEIKSAQEEISQKIDSNIFMRSIQSDTEVLDSNPVRKPLSQRQINLFNQISGSYNSLASETDVEVEEWDTDLDEYADEVETDVKEILATDEEVAEEVLDEIQEKIVPLKSKKNSPVNSERDRKLREEQKKVIVGTETIEQILERDANNIKIQVEDKSKVMHTSNKNMKQIKFTNFDKTYIEELFVKDLLSCFDMLKDKDSPFYITEIERKDTSNNLNYQETWIVKMKDETGKSTTLMVDIPKFQNNRFMLINGTRFMILKQNFYNPLVKDTPDTVILTTNYNKVTITRRATKSLVGIERIFSLIKKTSDQDLFMTGDSSKGNMKYISSLEYDELSRRLFRFKTKSCEIYFSRDYIKENIDIPSSIKGNEFMIGYEGNSPIFINEDTGLDRQGRTILNIIEQHLPEDYQKIYSSIKGPKQSMYVEAKMAGQFIPIIAILIIWNGLKKTLDRMNIKWNFDNTAKRVPANTPDKKYIRFADGVLEYESKTSSELIMNGLMKMHPEEFKFDDFESELGYDEFIYSQWGSYNGLNQLKNFNEFLVDPITKQVCKDMQLPDDATGLMIRAVELLCDNTSVSKASDKSYRVRSVEMIPSILYSCIADQYYAHIKSGRRLPMTLNRRCVISRLMAEKTVEPYSTLNPVVEVSKTHTISTKGYRGSNSDHSYDEEKRSYDPSAVGKIAISSSPDANVGINRNIVVEPTISNARGYREPVEDENDLKDVNIFSPTEMLTPGTAGKDDSIRTAISR